MIHIHHFFFVGLVVVVVLLWMLFDMMNSFSRFINYLINANNLIDSS